MGTPPIAGVILRVSLHHGLPYSPSLGVYLHHGLPHLSTEHAFHTGCSHQLSGIVLVWVRLGVAADIVGGFIIHLWEVYLRDVWGRRPPSCPYSSEGEDWT